MTLQVGVRGFIAGALVGLALVLIPAVLFGLTGPELVLMAALGFLVAAVCGLLGGAIEAAGGV